MNENHSHLVLGFYKFIPIEKAELENLREELNGLSQKFEIFGLIILAREGINGTVAGPSENLIAFKKACRLCLR